MTKINFDDLSFRTIGTEDTPFLYKVYRSTRIDEIGLAHWPEAEREEFIRSQFTLQHTQYMENYENAQFDIIMLNDEQIGRLYVQRTEKDIRIIDIALLREYRQKGIGATLLSELVQESEEKELPLSLYVEYNNPAMKLYNRLGFVKEDETGVYHLMNRKPTSLN